MDTTFLVLTLSSHICLTPLSTTSFCSAVNVYLPKDRITNNHQGYGFVEFRTEEDADYVSDPSSQISNALAVIH